MSKGSSINDITVSWWFEFGIADVQEEGDSILHDVISRQPSLPCSFRFFTGKLKLRYMENADS